MLRGEYINLTELSVWDRFCKELSCACVGLSGNVVYGVVTDENFGRTHVSSYKSLLFRILCTIATIGIVIWSIIDAGRVSWLYFASNWSLTANLLYFICITYITYKEPENSRAITDSNLYDGSSPKPSGLSKLSKIVWVLGNISLTTSIAVTLAFWSNVLFTDEAAFIFLLDHGLQALLMILDYIVGDQVFILGHVIHPSLLYIVYVIWSILHWELNLPHHRGDERYLYEVFDWSDPSVAGVNAFNGLLTIIAVYFATWVVFLCRPVYVRNPNTSTSIV